MMKDRRSMMMSVNKDGDNEYARVDDGVYNSPLLLQRNDDSDVPRSLDRNLGEGDSNTSLMSSFPLRMPMAAPIVGQRTSSNDENQNRPASSHRLR